MHAKAFILEWAHLWSWKKGTRANCLAKKKRRLTLLNFSSLKTETLPSEGHLCQSLWQRLWTTVEMSSIWEHRPQTWVSPEPYGVVTQICRVKGTSCSQRQDCGMVTGPTQQVPPASGGVLSLQPHFVSSGFPGPLTLTQCHHSRRKGMPLGGLSLLRYTLRWWFGVAEFEHTSHFLWFLFSPLNTYSHTCRHIDIDPHRHT